MTSTIAVADLDTRELRNIEADDILRVTAVPYLDPVRNERIAGSCLHLKDKTCINTPHSVVRIGWLLSQVRESQGG
jgi:hypothetical protein